ncbi:Peroxisomal membrane protein PEX29 [Escovopsis weberi]|uniref:Peroxisomal membrane protein PEX29 n=1 Tax=Escovopsis weberi TaxID=150374 RepID=A0A0M8N7L2_ESCWE|nr:Peroxisomal membrane protein PEX29 [Escovopsis weberi]
MNDFTAQSPTAGRDRDHVIPLTSDGLDSDPGAADAAAADDAATAYDQRPGFTLATMSNNFRRFNARIGVVFQFQAQMVRILSWRRPSHTMSLLAAYTFVCLDPYLLSVLPVLALVLGAFIPGFLARHPAPPKGTLSSEQMGYSPRGPPLAPAVTVRPVKELSKDFFRNMRDLQNCMEDFSQGHDQVVALLVPLTNFSDEALSSAVFLFLVVGGILMTLTAHIMPWRFIFLIGGEHDDDNHRHHRHSINGSNTHRRHHYYVHDNNNTNNRYYNYDIADSSICHGDDDDDHNNGRGAHVILDSAPETREVEIFQLQRDSGTGEWEPWVFCPSPYDPLSQARIAGERPRGTRFFEDVMPPDGWEWSEKKWALDLWSRDWVEERIITGVEVETEGERWVYDIYNDREKRTGVVDHLPLLDGAPAGSGSTSAAAASAEGRIRAPVMPQTSWEEGDDVASGRRGEWRRRRWVRLVKRTATADPVAS